MTWVLLGAIIGLVVGLFTDKLGLWIGIGAGAGVLYYLIRSMGSSGGCCCSTETKGETNEENQKEE